MGAYESEFVPNFSPGCTAGVGDAAALQTAVIIAGRNGQADTITLTAGCTYTLTSTLTVNADSGNTLTINGNGATISGGNARQVFYICLGAGVELNQVTITGGSDSFFGGGGIYNGGTLTITGSTISNSSAGSGGGIRNNNTLTIRNSMLSGNSASDDGGGIYNSGTLTIINSTLSGNSASDDGGGIYNTSTITISNSTFSGNSASDLGGGIANNSGTITLDNSIVANSTSGGDCVRLAGTINASYSLIESGLSGCATLAFPTTNLQVDPKLDASLRLLADSPAIDAGSNALIPDGVTTDLAGDSRIFGGTVDMGAYEFAPPATATPTPTATSTATETATATETSTPTATATATATGTATETITPTVTGTPTMTSTATDTFTPSATPTGTLTPLATLTLTPTGTPPPTLTLMPTSAATALADYLSVQTDGVITSTGGLNIVTRDGDLGNLYASVINTDSTLSPEAMHYPQVGEGLKVG
jgi:predicted outer membrane repeat protein